MSGHTRTWIYSEGFTDRSQKFSFVLSNDSIYWFVSSAGSPQYGTCGTGAPGQASGAPPSGLVLRVLPQSTHFQPPGPAPGQPQPLPRSHAVLLQSGLSFNAASLGSDHPAAPELETTRASGRCSCLLLQPGSPGYASTARWSGGVLHLSATDFLPDFQEPVLPQLLRTK